MSDQILDSNLVSKKQEDLDGSNGILRLGILSLVLISGFVGVVIAIVTLNRAKDARTLYKQRPGIYTESSYKKVNAGRICALISLSLICSFIGVLMVLSSIH
jgi:hypothetical protein